MTQASDSQAQPAHPLVRQNRDRAAGAWVGALILAQILVWTLIPYVCGRSLPLDVVSDGLAWGHEWQWGYYKHPPLPSWEVEIFFRAFGDLGPYLLSQVSIAATYLLVFLTGREIMPARWAMAGTLLTACVYYFSIPTPEFNHNVAQMPLWAAAVYTYYKATHARNLHWWLLLGVSAGLALLTKYASGILLVLIAADLLLSPIRRIALATPGPYLALLTCALVISPHLLWLAQNHFPTLSYAARRAGSARGIASRVLAPVRFLLSQLLDVSPAIAVAAIAGLVGRETFQRFSRDKTFDFLATFTLGPPLLTAVLSLVLGMGLRDMWGAPMWDFAGLLIVYASRPRWDRLNWSRLGACIAVAFVVLPTAYVLATDVVPALKGKPSRTQWPDREIAQAFETAYVRQTGKPLRIVAADGWLAGLVAMRASSRPSVLTDGNMQESPWITPARLSRQGALVLWRGDSAALPHTFPLKGIIVLGAKTFAWPDSPKAKPLTIHWGIVAPKNA